MSSRGWQRAKPAGSRYWTVRGGEGRRLDHAFATDHIRILRSEYITEFGPFMFAGKGTGAMSDHAALLVELSRQGQNASSGCNETCRRNDGS